MVAISKPFDANWSGQPLVLVALRDGQELASTPANELIQSGVYIARGTLDLANVVAGNFTLVLRNAEGEIAAISEEYVNASGQLGPDVPAPQPVQTKASSGTYYLAKDLLMQIPSQTAEDSLLVWSARRCLTAAQPSIEVDSQYGLKVVAGIDIPTPGHAKLTRLSGTQVQLSVRAAAFSHLLPAKYYVDLTEVGIDGPVILRHAGTIFLDRAAGRRMA